MTKGNNESHTQKAMRAYAKGLPLIQGALTGAHTKRQSRKINETLHREGTGSTTRQRGLEPSDVSFAFPASPLNSRVYWRNRILR